MWDVMRPAGRLGPRARRLGIGIALALALLTACAGAPVVSRRHEPVKAVTSVAVVASASAAPTLSASAAPKSSRPVTPLGPPPVVTQPMAGEPASSALVQARLVATTCAEQEAATKEAVAARIAEMTKALEESYETWLRQQPECRARKEFCREHPENCPEHGPRGSSSLRPGASGGGLAGIGATGRGTASSVSTTNVQVAGVDEPDLVKTDGRYVYLVTGGSLRIIEALKPRVLSVTKLTGEARSLFVEGDRAVVYTKVGGQQSRPCTYAYDCQFAGDGSTTEVLVFDLKNRSAPRQLRRLEVSASLLAARRIGSTVHTVVSGNELPDYPTFPPGVATCGTDDSSTLRIKLAQLRQANERLIRRAAAPPTLREAGKERVLCDRLMTSAVDDGSAYTSLLSFDMNDARGAVEAVTIRSRPGAVFASADALYLAVRHEQRHARGWYSFWTHADEVSDIHKFALGQRPADTRYAATGVVRGHVLNQFSMDEYYGYLRIATSQGRVPNPDVQSSISIFAEDAQQSLVRVGAIEGLARGEDIRAVRFDADRGYIVTFKKTDPLFVADLYDPAQPRLLGELKIPGFSTYLQRIDRTRLLSIGYDAEDRNNFALFGGVMLQLFDVAEPTEPKLLHREIIGTRGTSSQALTDHHAFNYLPERGLLAVPMTICDGGAQSRFGELSFSGLLVYQLDMQSGFKQLGRVAHAGRNVHCRNWWTRATSEVQRSVFLDDLVYSIARDELKVQRLGAFGSDVANLTWQSASATRPGLQLRRRGP